MIVTQPVTYSGRCQCGAVSATIAGEPLAVRQCWCRQCQQVSGGGATTNALFKTADITLIGKLARHDYLAASGNTLSQRFCAACGTPVMGESSARPHMKAVRVGFLDGPHGLAPQMAIWTDDAPGWAVIDPALERHARQPPSPAPKV